VEISVPKYPEDSGALVMGCLKNTNAKLLWYYPWPWGRLYSSYDLASQCKSMAKCCWCFPAFENICKYDIKPHILCHEGLP
jgi:hypothetical protein